MSAVPSKTSDGLLGGLFPNPEGQMAMEKCMVAKNAFEKAQYHFEKDTKAARWQRRPVDPGLEVAHMRAYEVFDKISGEASFKYGIKWDGDNYVLQSSERAPPETQSGFRGHSLAR